MNLRAAIDQGLKMEAQYKDIPESYDEARKALRAAIEQALKMEQLNYAGCMEDLKEAEKALGSGEPVATVTLNESMVTELKFTRPHTLLPGQVLYVYTAPQPKQEPVAWAQNTEMETPPSDGLSWVQTQLHTVPLYTAAPQPQPDHFRDATKKVDALPRQALELIEAWERGAESADYWFEIAALRERLKA
jgi:hypothetical protein